MTRPDLSEVWTSAFRDLGWTASSSAVVVSSNFNAVQVIVMNGDQAKSVIQIDADLKGSIALEDTVILVAAAKPRDRPGIGEALEGAGIHLTDSPLSGSLPREECGTFRMMASVSDAILDKSTQMMNPVSATLKACLFVAKAKTKGDSVFRVPSPKQWAAPAPMPQWNLP